MKNASKIKSIKDFYHYSSIMHAKERILEIVEHLKNHEKSIVHFSTMVKESSMFQEQYRFSDFYKCYTNSFEVKKNQITLAFENLHQLFNGNVLYWYCDIIEPVMNGTLPEYDGFLKFLYT
jgi:vacuolar-type H+-ATPase catalytic subunit A/Vma1